MTTMNLSRKMLDLALADAHVEKDSAVSAAQLPDGKPLLQIELSNSNKAVQVVASLTLSFNEEFGRAWAMVFADRGEIQELHEGVLLQYTDVQLGYGS